MTTLRTFIAGAKTPQKLVILLHGLGADGQDLIGLADVWAQHLRDVQFVSPDAPFPCDMAPYGRQWFSLQSREPDFVRAGVAAACPIVDAFITEQQQRLGLTDADTVVSGFSQGAMMSLAVATHRAGQVAGILAYSGRLVLDVTDAPQHPPVCLVHGDADEVVPVTAYDEAVPALKEAGFPLESHRLTGLGHGIDDRGLAAGLSFMKRVFAL